MRKNDYTLEFTLRQHTPIIHFQHDQRGATLRATELKPKLDRFLRNRVHKELDAEHPNRHRSLPYKIVIEPDSSKSQEIPPRDPLYFGNMKPREMSDEEWKNKKKRFKFNPNPFRIRFVSMENRVLNAIEANFKAFLANHNFGTRQSKGFGSFYLWNETFHNDAPFDPSLIDASRVFSFTSSQREYREDIRLFYAFLRQGINLKNRNKETLFYTKPAIFSYAKTQGWIWEKKTIKEKFFDKQRKAQIQEHGPVDVLTFDKGTPYLVRDLFGLSSSQEWFSYRARISKVHNPSKNEKEILRFRSPLQFKPIMTDRQTGKMKIYFWYNESVNAILSKSFTISKSPKKNSDGLLNISTPSSFSFDDFFDHVLGLNLASHVDSIYHQSAQYKILNRILQEIRSGI